MKKIAVLISNAGTGTNLQAIIDGVSSGKIKAQVAVVISDKEDALGLKRAKKNNLQIAICHKKEDLLLILQKFQIDLVCLTGWKQIIPEDVMHAYKNKVLNAHPGIIPDDKNKICSNPDGTEAIWNKGKFTNRAMQNIFDKKATYAGSSIHFLTNEVDFGPVLERCFEKIQPNDTVESLYTRLKKKENEIYVLALAKLCN